MANEILISNDQDKIKVVKEMEDLVIKSCNAVLKNEGIEDDCEISVTFVDNEKIAKLNGEFRNKPCHPPFPPYSDKGYRWHALFLCFPLTGHF